MTRRLVFCAILASACAIAADAPSGALRLPLRTRVEPFKGSGEWQEVHLERTLPVARTAIVICDMWDKHWCGGANRRVGALAERMNPVLDRARAYGIQIVHAPSDVMDFYKDAPQRRRILALAKIEPPAPALLADPPL